MAEVAMKPKLIAEFTGTFLLVFTIGCNVLAQTAVWAGVSIACMLMVAIFAFGGVSGANFNPAVSVALGINGNMSWQDVGYYCAVQLAGGITAGIAYFLYFFKAFNLGPAKDFNIFSAGACELLYTFMLCFVVLNVAAVKKGCQQWYGLAIGFVIVAGAYGAGAVSGGCFNPAVAFGIDVSAVMYPMMPTFRFGYSFAYTAFELAGAALAAVLFKVIRPNGGTADEEYTLTSKLAAEFIGTYMLVLTVGLNVLGGSPAGAFSIAASLMCMIYALGDVSGANFNPAVSLALAIFKAMDFTTAGQYMGVQFLGGIAASLTYAGIYGFDARIRGLQLGPSITSDHTWAQAGVAEIIFTFVLCLVVLCVAVHEKTKSENFFALAIGSCVTAGGFAIGSISGGSLNPAVSLGIAVPHMVTSFRSAGYLFAPVLLYTIFEFIGAALAATLVGYTHVDAIAEKECEA